MPKYAREVMIARDASPFRRFQCALWRAGDNVRRDFRHVIDQRLPHASQHPRSAARSREEFRNACGRSTMRAFSYGDYRSYQTIRRSDTAAWTSRLSLYRKPKNESTAMMTTTNPTM
jgi:hypothetical protein